MATRMDRYYDKPRNPRARSTRNENLYKEIQDLDAYSNIEAVATISNNNEIDITKVKELVKNRENYKKTKKYRNALNIEPVNKKEEANINFFNEEKNYDIMDVLNKAKDEHDEKKDEIRSLKDTHFDMIKDLKINNKDEKTNTDGLKDLIDNISQKDINNTEEIGLFNDLTSDTMVGEASSIHKVLEQEKIDNKKIDNTAEMDKTFFTSTMGFTEKDFEDLQNIKHKVKRNNALVIALIIIFCLVIIGLTIFLIVRR